MYLWQQHNVGKIMRMHPKCFTNIETLYYNSISRSSFIFLKHIHIIAVQWKSFFYVNHSIKNNLWTSENPNTNIIHSLGYLDVMKRGYQAQQAFDFGLASSLKKYHKNPVSTSCKKVISVKHFHIYLSQTVCYKITLHLLIKNLHPHV